MRQVQQLLIGLGCLLTSVFICGSANAATCNSAGGVNNWSTIGVWSCGHVPINGDDVVISAGDNITLDINSNALASLTVDGALIVGASLNINDTTASFLTINGGGTVTIGNSTVARAIVVTGDISVVGTGTFSVGATAATHTLTAGGNITNAGTINFAPTVTRVCNITFTKNGNQTVSGTGAYTFNLITLNMGATNTNVLDMKSAMTVPSPFLTITNGTYKHSNPSNITPWTTAAAATIPAGGGFWLNSTATVTTTGFNVTVNGGLFRISAGTMNIGSANTTLLVLNNAATTLFQMDGGALTVTGGINSSVNTGAGTFTMSGGTITLMTVSAGAVYTFLLGSATTFNMSGGTIIATIGNNATDDVDIRSATQNVTGGTLQFGSAATTGTNPISLRNSTGGQVNVWNLVLASGITKSTLLRSVANVQNDLTIQALNTLNDSGGFAINIGGGNASGNWTNNGAFTRGTSTVTFTGSSAAPTIGGTTATTFNNLRINKASNNLTINTTPTVNDTLTFTSGKIATGANRVILGTTGTVATPSATSYVVGSIQKNYLADAALNFFAGNDFPIGDATNFTPVDITGGTTTTAGNLTVSTIAGDHPQVTTPIVSTGIDAAKSVNRYWRMNNSGLTVGTVITSTFTFVAADIDVGANPANFIVQRYDGSIWNPTTLVAANALNTQVTNITALVAGNNDFADGEVLAGAAVPGSFNAFETSTAANAIVGFIRTKIAGTAFSLDVVAINNGAQLTSFFNNVRVELLGNTALGVALDAQNCPTSFTLLQTIASTAIVNGRSTVNFAAVANVFRDVRVRIRFPTGAPTVTSCSTDNFAIRPNALSLVASDNDLTTAGVARTLNNAVVGGGVVHKAGQPFTLRATALNSAGATTNNYAGTPTIRAGSPTCSLPAGCVTVVPTLGAWTLAGGVATSSTAQYDEVGVIALELEDRTFASVDTTDGSSFTIPQSGGPLTIGRFVPDHLVLGASGSPQFKTFGSACASRSFTYIGQPFGYVTVPAATITAQNVSGATTANYKGTLWKLSSGSITQAYSAAQTLDTGLVGAPVVVANNNGTGTATANSADVLAFTRNTATAQAPFNAAISLTMSASDTSENGVSGNGAIGTTTTASFTPIGFDAGTLFRYGRLKLANAHGSELLDLPITLETQFFNGTSFVTNTSDQCSSFAATTVVMSNYQKNLAACETSSTMSGTVIDGKANLKLTKPGSGNSGSVDLSVNLNSAASGFACIAGVSTPATAANQAYLQGAWTGVNYDQNPTSRATFGVFKNANEFIFMRERF